MNAGLEGLEAAVEAMLVKEKLINGPGIRQWITNFRALPAFAVSDDEAERLARRIETRHDITMRVGASLIEPGFLPWLEGRRSSIEFYYWQRYRKLLEQKHLSRQVITAVSQDTDRILSLLGDPVLGGEWSRRGMVVGHVQSGKTANYIGLIAKAADAGYRLIIVIAGVHNNLRNQTQKRIDEGLVGRDSARLLSSRVEEHFIGVGKIDSTRRPTTFTNSLKDFSKSMATGVGVPLRNLREPAVFVIKKQRDTLKNLIEWVREHNAAGKTKVDAPLLLIDDEADNASINTAYGRDETTLINGRIRELLQLFTRSSYVGYTATPFANIFIDPDTDDEMLGQDLFPRHFIVSLDPPSNYVGPGVLFRQHPERHIRDIEDASALLPSNHKIDHLLTVLPESLKDAIRYFVLSRAVRLVRGHSKAHCSAMVNASRFPSVHKQLAREVLRLVEDISGSIRLYGADIAAGADDSELKELKRVWSNELKDTGVTWEAMSAHLLDAAARIRVVEINSKSADALNYDDYSDGLSVIAIGGLSLSRGLTLEGLNTSYFHRNSMMYDTLMQMGRWFGYRDGYEDLCRVWMPPEAESWYAHISESTEMLRAELRRMAAAGATPEQFGLKVRAHPDTLIVTARNKMGAGEKVVVKVGLGKQFVETSILKADMDSLERNRRALDQLGADLEELGYAPAKATEGWGGFLLSGVPVEPIKGFLAGFLNDPRCLLAEATPLLNYIRDREADELSQWDILFASLAKPGEAGEKDFRGLRINCQRRSAGTRGDTRTIYITDNQRVASRGIEKVGISPDLVSQAEARYADGLPADKAKNVPDRIYREVRTKPLLIVHLLKVGDKEEVRSKDALVAWSISFPDTARPEERVEYVVTTAWLRENFREDVDPEEEWELD